MIYWSDFNTGRFHVRRVNHGVAAQRIPGASHSQDMFVGACSGDAPWRSTHASCSPTSPFPWAKLAQPAIRILVGAVLPRAVRIGKEDLDREPLGHLLVLGHLFAPIVRQRVAQCGGHVPECLRNALAGTRRIRPLHPNRKR
jgi:hypothetical protein